MRAEAKTFVSERLQALSQLPFDQLQQLPPANSRTIDITGVEVVVTEWINLISADALTIVVQAYRPYLLGIGSTYADGIRISRDGTKTALIEAELMAYM